MTQPIPSRALLLLCGLFLTLPADAALRRMVAVDVAPTPTPAWFDSDELQDGLTSVLQRDPRFDTIATDRPRGVIIRHSPLDAADPAARVPQWDVHVELLEARAAAPSGSRSAPAAAARLRYEVAIAARVVDTATSVVVATATFRAERVDRATSRGAGRDEGRPTVGARLADALTQDVVIWLADQARTTPWRTTVVEQARGVSRIRGGHQDGLRLGMRLHGCDPAIGSPADPTAPEHGGAERDEPTGAAPPPNRAWYQVVHVEAHTALIQALGDHPPLEIGAAVEMPHARRE